MPDQKITDLTEDSTPTVNDFVPTVDDSTLANRKVKLGLLPISTATANALALKAPLASPALTGTPTAPTAAPATNTTQVATTAYADAKVAEAIIDNVTGVAPSQNAVFDALALKAPLVSPALTGTPTAPTAAPATSTTQVATTAYATAADLVGSNALLTHDALASGVHSAAFDTFSINLLQFDPTFLQSYAWLYDDFFSDSITTNTIGSHGWSHGFVGTGVITTAASDLGGPGVISLNVPNVTDTSSVTLNAYSTIGSPWYVMEWRARLSVITADYAARFGAMDLATVAPSSGAWFEKSITSLNWLFKTADDTLTSPEVTDTGVVLDTLWHRFRIVSDGVSAISASIDGVSIPTPHTQRSTTGLNSPKMGVYRNSGSTSNRNLRIDYTWFLQRITR